MHDREDRFAIAQESYELFPKDLASILKLPGLERFANPDDRLLEISSRQYDLALRRSPLVPVRAVQRLFGASPWEWAVDDTDLHFGKGSVTTSLQASSGGADVVGHRLNLGDGLTRDQAIFLLALMHLRRPGDADTSKRPMQTDAEEIYERLLLCHVTREVRDPPIDLDVRDESNEWSEKGGLEYTRRTNTDYAKRLIHQLANFGAKPVVHVTNAEKWSIHLDVLAPAGVRSATLSTQTARIKRMAMEAAEIPEARDFRDHKAGPAIVCDSSIWIRDPDSRSGVWRPPLGRKFDKRTGKHKPHRKLWLKDLDDPSSLQEPPPGLEPVPFDADCL